MRMGWRQLCRNAYTGTRENIRCAVDDAVSTLAPGGGFVLSAVDALFEDTPSENIVSMIEAWRNVATYPIDSKD